jgi:hypothetical protein
MESYRICIGLVIRENEVSYQFDNEVAGEKFVTYVFKNQQTGKPRLLTLAQLNQGIQSGQFRLVRQGNEPIGSKTKTKTSIRVSDLKKEIRDDLLRKVAWVRLIRHDPPPRLG